MQNITGLSLYFMAKKGLIQNIKIKIYIVGTNFTQFKRYSAATIAVAYDLIERLMVETIIAPLGTANAPRDLQNSAGSATCSITWSMNLM